MEQVHDPRALYCAAVLVVIVVWLFVQAWKIHVEEEKNAV